MRFENARPSVDLMAVKPALKVATDVAIVGSSATLLECDYGKEIDRHSEVVRFNGAPAVGYERQVGSKTTVQLVGIDLAYQYNPAYLQPSKTEKQNEEIRRENARRMVALFPGCKFLTHEPRDDLGEEASPRYATAKYLRLADPEVSIYCLLRKGRGSFYTYYETNRDLESLGLSSRLSFGGPRSGIKIVMRCVLSGIKPRLFGFDIDPAISVATHYHDGVINAKVAENRSHDIRGEMDLLADLHRSNLIEVMQ